MEIKAVKALSTGFVCACLLACPAAAQDAAKAAAVVNGHAISEQEVQTVLDQAMKQAMSRRPPEKDQAESFRERMRERVIKSLILDYLLENEAEKAGVGLDQKALVASLDEQFRMQVESMGRTPEEYEQTVLKGRGLSWDQFIQAIAQDPDAQKVHMFEKLVRKKFPEQVKASPEQVRKYYDSNLNSVYHVPDQVRASHILFETKSATTDKEKKAVEKQARKVLALAKKPGADFAALAREHSACPSKQQGGDLGFFTRERMAPPFSEAAFSMKPGEMSDLVETQFGYHIIKVTDKKPEKTVPFDSVKASITRMVEMQNARAQLGVYAQELLDNAKVERP